MCFPHLLLWQSSQPAAQYRMVALLDEQGIAAWELLLDDINRGQPIEKMCEQRGFFWIKDQNTYILIYNDILINEKELACGLISSLQSTILLEDKLIISKVRERNQKEFLYITNWLQLNSIYQIPNLSRADFALREVGMTPVGIILCEVELSDRAKFSVTMDILPIGSDFEADWQKQEAYTIKPKTNQREKETTQENRFTLKPREARNSIQIRSIPTSMSYEEIAVLAQKGLQHIIDKSIKDQQRYEECLSALKDLIQNRISYHDVKLGQSVSLEELPDPARDAVMEAFERYRKAHSMENVTIRSVHFSVHPGVKIGLLLREQGGYMGAVVDLEKGSVARLFWGGPAVSEGMAR